MNGIGWTPVGPVHGTWVAVVFTDDDLQYPLMIGTLPGIPQSKAAQIAVEESDSDVIATDGGVLTSSSGAPVTSADGTPVQVGTTESQSKPSSTAPSSSGAAQPKLTDQKEPNKPSDASLKKDIPTDPPKGSTPNPSQAKTNIQHLIDACEKVGLTSKYAKCAVLGICGGESGWLAVEEGSYYSKAESLSAIFKRSFPTPADAQPYVKWAGTKAEFFKKIYSPSGNGALLGHKGADDGAKYYGRGFNQITGKSLYIQLQKFLATKGIIVDFENKPQSLIDDPATSALATAAFYALNVKANQNDPSYFQAALKRTGADANGTGYEKKRKYYEYFLGESVSVDSTNKPAADAAKTYTADEVKDLPPGKQAALLEDRSSNNTIGFTDPSGKYPLRNLMDEPDTNRLARGVQKETAIEFKDSTRIKSIGAPNGQDSWEQPLAPFGGMYPYSKVFESESGHLLVYDDTPLNENISFYHKVGSFIDIDSNGTMVQRIVGDGYQIIDKNGAIYIGGKCNLTVGNSVNILVEGAADIEVKGVATVNLHNNADIGVGGDLTLAVGGDMKVQAGGTISMKAGSAINLESGEATTAKAGGAIEMKAGAGFGIHSASDTSIEAGGAFSASAGSTAGIKAGGDAFVNAGGSTNILASGSANMDGATANIQAGSSQPAPSVAAPGLEPESLALTPPSFEAGASDQFPFMTTPVRPSPPINIAFAIDEENEKAAADYLANPDKYYNPTAAEGGVKPNYAGTPKDDGSGGSLISGGATGDIYKFLEKQLQLGSGHWGESGMGGAPSNPNITRIWADLGFPKSGMWLSDQTAWCMGFVNWTLKQCGYRYRQSAGAKEIASMTDKWGATRISDMRQAEPGDIALWSYSHVNFVYSNNNGKLTFVGGNQADKAANNPTGGSVTRSWPGGYQVGKDNTLVAIFRPSKS
jgi:predicted chitinase